MGSEVEKDQGQYFSIEVAEVEDLVRIAACLPSGGPVGIPVILHLEKRNKHVYLVIPIFSISDEEHKVVFYSVLEETVKKKFAKYKVEDGKEEISFTNDLKDAEAKYFPIITIKKLERAKEIP